MNSGIFFIIAAAVLWGTTGTTQAFAPEGASPLTIGAFRLLIGGVGLVIVAIAGRSFTSGAKWNKTHILLGALSVAAYQITFFSSVLLTGVAVGTIVAIASSPVSAGILGSLILKEKLAPKWYLATVLAVIGCSVLVLSGGGEISINPLGVAAALGAGLSYALYTLFGKMLLDAGHKGNGVVAMMFFGGAVVLTPILFFNDISWVATSKGVITMAHLGILTTTVSYMLFAKGLKTISISKTATLSLAEPLTAAVLGVVVLGEKLNVMSGIGIFCLFAGIAILSIESKKSSGNT